MVRSPQSRAPRPGTTADSTKALADTVRALDRAWGQAYTTGNVGVLEAIIADDWSGWLASGHSTKGQEIADMRAGRNHTEKDELSGAMVRIFGNSAVVEAEEATLSGPPGHATWHHQRIQDVFVRHAGRWQVVATLDAPSSS